MAFLERTQLWTLQIEHAEAAIPQEDRDDQLRAHVGEVAQIPTIDRRVGYQYRLLVQRGIAHQAFAELEARDRVGRAVVLDGHLHLELAGRRVEEEDAERPVVDDPAHEVRDARKQLVKVENRRDVTADLGQQLERLSVFMLALEQPRVGDRHRDMGAELPENRQIRVAELSALVTQERDRADWLRLVEQRDHEAGLGLRHCRRMTPVGRQVVDQQRLFLGTRAANETVAYLPALACVRRRPDSRWRTRSEASPGSGRAGRPRTRRTP